MGRRKKGGGGGEDCGSWMDTYGDMVTLLLCFFVMLYSMSNLDQQKWEIFVKSIFPNSNELEQIAVNENISEGDFDVSGNLEMDQEEVDAEKLEDLYLVLVKKLNDSGIDGVSVSQGDGYTFVAFENHAFFNGDSSVLTQEAMEVLDIFSEIIAPEADRISQIEILGHTAQARADSPNNARPDRLLSGMRSAEVAAYIQNKGIIDPSKLVGISYGQFRPVDTSQTSEGRAKNRRVEFLIVDSGADIKSMNDYYDEYYGRLEEGSVLYTDGNSTEPAEGFEPIDNGSMEGDASMVPESAINDSGQQGQSPEPTVSPPEGAAAP